MRNTKTKSIMALILAVIIWGTAYPVLADIINSGVDVGLVNLLRFCSAFLFLAPFFIRDIIHATKREFLFSLGCGFLLFMAFIFMSFSLSYENSTPGECALIISAGIFVAPLLDFFINKKRPSILSVLGLALTFIGIILFSSSTNIGFGFNLGIVYSFTSAIFFGFHIFVLTTFIKKSNEKAICAMQLFFTFLFFLIYMLIFRTNSLIMENISPKALFEILYLGIVASGIAYLLQTKASKNLSVNVCNILINLESLFALLISTILGLETITVLYVIGTLLIICGTVLVVKNELVKKVVEASVLAKSKEKENLDLE